MAKTIDVRCDKTGVIFDVSTKRIFVEDVKTLTNGQIAVLECGDFVVKQTGNQKHTYKVTYKEENVGLCITYEDATLVETVSYDWNGEKWVYNSTDISNIEGGSGTTVVANPTLAGTEADLTGLEVNGAKYKVGGGTITLDDIVDSAGNKRFVEGNGTPATINGATFSYCKWSLSGTHLMLVLAGTVDNGTTITTLSKLATFTLPTWILNKIYPVWDNAYTEIKTVPMYNNVGSSQDQLVTLKKNSTTLEMITMNSVSYNANRGFRIQFDLLIDAS